MTAAVWIFEQNVRYTPRPFHSREQALWSMLYACYEVACSDGRTRSLSEAHTVVEVRLVERRRSRLALTPTPDLPRPLLSLGSNHPNTGFAS